MASSFAAFFKTMVSFVYAAIIPGPKEPRTDEMNHILRPMIDELQILKDGVVIDGMVIRLKIMCWSCDLPAARKSLGWLACTATMGCSKCKQKLRGEGADLLTIGPPRTGQEHRDVGDRLQVMERTSTRTAMSDYEKETGIRCVRFIHSLSMVSSN